MPYKKNKEGRKKNAEYQKNWYQANRAKKIAQSKRNKLAFYLKVKPIIDDIKSFGCPCGENNPVCLDFHHRDPKLKEFNISHAIRKGYNLDRILDEITKCDVICSNCHRKLTWGSGVIWQHVGF